MKKLIFIFVLLVQSAFAALSSSTVWEVRSAGADTAGGGFVTGASGTDFTQQDAAQYALTGVTTTGADAILLHASAASDMVGNICQITSGTNFTVGFYEILSVSVGVSITLDRTCTSAAGVGGVVNIGGALATIGKIGSATVGLGAVAGNAIWMKGSFSLGAADTLAFSGTTTLPIRIAGYATTRGDGYLGRASSFGSLTTTNMPTLTYSAAFRLNASGAWVTYETLNIVTAFSGNGFAVGANSAVRACKIINSSTNAAACAISFGTSSNATAVDCDIELTGASGGTSALNATGTGSKILANRIKGGPAVGAIVRTTFNLSGNLIFDCAGDGVQSDSTTGSGVLLNNTIVDNGGDGIQIATGATGFISSVGNMITDNGGYGLNATDAANAVLFSFNRTRDNTLGATNGSAGWIAASNLGNVTTDTGGQETDYTNAGASNYSLISTSPAVGVNIQPPSSMGALQRSGAGGGQKSATY